MRRGYKEVEIVNSDKIYEKLNAIRKNRATQAGKGCPLE